ERARLDRVELHPLVPARREEEECVAEVVVRGDREARLEEQAAPKLRRHVELELRRPSVDDVRARALAEHVRETEEEERAEQREEPVTNRAVEAGAVELEVARELDAVGNCCHAGGFAGAPRCSSCLTCD